MHTPTTIAHYHLLELIGQDGPIEIWRARDSRLQRIVAVQVLRRGPDTPQEEVDRFRRQAHVASLVTHPHVCAVHNWGEEDGQPYVVRELLSGQRLDEVIGGVAMPVDRAVELAVQLTGALSAVHRRGLVHGHVRPSNVRVTTDGHVKLLGLGTAVADPAASAPDLGAFATTAVDIDPALTDAAPDEGDPYLSPEQVAGHPPIAASDVFAAGALLYEMVTGRPPFAGATPAELSKAILSSPPVPVRRLNRRVSIPLAAVIARAIAKDPARAPCVAPGTARRPARGAASSPGRAGARAHCRVSGPWPSRRQGSRWSAVRRPPGGSVGCPVSAGLRARATPSCSATS